MYSGHAQGCARLFLPHSIGRFFLALGCMRITKTGRKLFDAHLDTKACAACFNNSHTSECGLRRKERPINFPILFIYILKIDMAFQKYSHLDQSLFARFVRLGVPTIDLDMQGRARPSIAELYNWRYKVMLTHIIVF